MKKKLFIVLMLVLFPLNCFALVKPTTDFYVNDYANIIDSDVEEYIMGRSVDLANKTGAQIVVVTVNNLEGKNLEEYATTLFRNFGIGDKENNNGLLLLLALEERQFRVEVGYGLEGVLPDGLTGRYQDEYIIPYLKKNDWNTGIKTGYTAFYKKICEYYGIEMTNDTLNISAINNSNDYDNITLMGIVIFSIIGSLQGTYCREASKGRKKKISKVYIIFSMLLLIWMISMVFFKSFGWIIYIFFKTTFLFY